MTVLEETVLGLATCMERDADRLEKEIKGPDKRGLVFLRAYASDLRSAAKRARGEISPPEVEITKSDPELERLTKRQEQGSFFVELDGGALHGSSVGCDPKMPEGAKVPFNGVVYIYREGKLRYSSEETAKLKRPV